MDSRVLPDTEQINYLCAVGLGPIAYAAYGEDFKKSDPKIFDALYGAELATRLIYSQIETAAEQVARDLQDIGIVPIFLKGISTSNEFYAPPYHRVMADLDILVRDSEVDLVMSKIGTLGYEISGDQWRVYQEIGHHHLPEARHPDTGICIEVHTGLFAPDEFYANEAVFQADVFLGQTANFDFKGSRVARFTPEYQLVFTVSKWSVDRDWAINIKNINDLIHILRKHETSFDWPVLTHWFEKNPHLVPITSALIQYLEQADLVTVSPQMHAALDHPARKLASRSAKTIAWLLHTFPFNARDKRYSGYARWSAHALWLYLTKPDNRDLGIPGALWQQFYLSLLYGKYSPFGKLLAGIRKSPARMKRH